MKIYLNKIIEDAISQSAYFSLFLPASQNRKCIKVIILRIFQFSLEFFFLP